MPNTDCKITYYVNGMHCAACETLIEKTINEQAGVKKVNASLANNKVEIVAENKARLPEVEKLNKEFAELGYSFHKEKAQEKKLSPEDIYKIGISVVVLLGAFIFIEKTGLLSKVSVNSSSSFVSFFFFGLAAGVSSCAALVGGLLLALSNQWNKAYGGNTKKNFIPFVLFNSGRLLSFALLGALLGIVGSYLKLSLSSTAFLTLAIAIVMIILGLQMLDVSWARKIKLTTPKFIAKRITDENKFKGKYMPFVVGVLTFFLPCGFTLIAQTSALNAGNMVSSGAMMLAFALGTLPMLALISFTSVKMLADPKFSKIFNTVAGIVIIFFSIYSVNSQLNVLGLPSLSDIKVPAQSNEGKALAISDTYVGDVQYLQMEATEFEYFPKVVRLKAGVPVKWEFYNNGAQGCAQAVAARGLYQGVFVLKPGLNETEFTPRNKGTYKITCTMGMVPPVTVYVY
ncbi:hypothetical protein A2619_02100 [candidate division WWE3 bacterium RIFOXYD1_FULL_39_9]|uniref:HMA domain-containing protein n=1 Tax=candidate division WWE3 bacterium RIFOXYD1_FULL_39_9 TaxID=1802649 RepID=A0A1F4X361_UNCKA|nr:MAG: hypothetical protein A2619_02100 [candidate division WWE3 bacterium RIFOXYD1_FULL_39_9]